MPDMRLSFQNAPPLMVPLRFFLTAPWFMALAAVLLLWHGPDLLAQRWAPFTIAATHLLTLGFMTMVMLGALFQIIPVLCGSTLPAPVVTGTTVYAGLVVGTLLFCTGLVTGGLWLFGGLLLLLGALGVFLAAAALALARAPGRDAGRQTLPLAVVALLGTALCGVAAALARAGISAPWFPLHLSALHVGWALLGWVGLLIIGVSYEVVPMFQMTPDYPVAVRRGLGPLVFLALAAWTLALGAGIVPVALQLEWLIAIAFALFAGITLYLQHRRRRRIADTTQRCFSLGLLCLLGAVGTWLLRNLLPAQNAVPMLLGLLVIVGFAQSIITGMLYKIVPFLCWLHLQNAGIRGAKMQDFIGERRARRQFRIHVAALAGLIAALFAPALARPAAVALGLAGVGLGVDMAWALRTFRRMQECGPPPLHPAR